MKATSSGPTLAISPGVEMSAMSSLKSTWLGCGQWPFADVLDRRRDRFFRSVYKNAVFPSWACDIENLLPVLITDTDGERHRNDASELAGPEDVDKLPVVIQKENEVVALADAMLLQDMQQSQCALEQGLETNALLIFLPVDETDKACFTAIV